MFSVDENSRANYYKYLAKLNFEAADAADKSVGFWPGYELVAPPPVMTLCAHSIELSGFVAQIALRLDLPFPQMDSACGHGTRYTKGCEAV